MQVTIETHTGKGIGSGKLVTFNQYRIRVDGKHAGYIGCKPGSNVCLTRRFSPMDRKEIEKQVAVLLERESVKSTQPPEVPDAALQMEGANADDLDS